MLEWLSDDENRELADEIEAVNSRMLERLLDESPFLAVFFCKYFACRLTLVAITALKMFPISLVQAGRSCFPCYSTLNNACLVLGLLAARSSQYKNEEGRL